MKMLSNFVSGTTEAYGIKDLLRKSVAGISLSEDEAGRVKEMALKELQMLEEDRSELESEYALNPNSERILNALLMNQQKRSEILDRIINTLNQIN